jgi:hypothetical protein
VEEHKNVLSVCGYIGGNNKTVGLCRFGLVWFCVTKTADGWEWVCEFDMEVNYVDGCTLYKEHC